MDVKVKKDGTWAITPAGPIEDIVVGQIIGDKYTEKFRQDLVDTGYADPVIVEVPEPEFNAEGFNAEGFNAEGQTQGNKWDGFDVGACEDKIVLFEYAFDKFEANINKNKSLENVKAEIKELQVAKDAGTE